MGYRFYTRQDIDRLPQLQNLPAAELEAMKVVSAVFPFRVNDYVVEQLIDWSRVPEDPIFQLTFPQHDMLCPDDFQRVQKLLRAGAPAAEMLRTTREIQGHLNPHPAGQMDLNVPEQHGQRLEGIQHKYRETVLFFPAAGQTCHAYCTYCFRWAQFVGDPQLKFSGRDTSALVAYLREHPEVTSVLVTGGDPAVMKTSVLRRYIEPLLEAGLEHVESIRIGTKAPAYWPARFVSDADADDLLRLFDEVVAAKRHLALMAHYSHPRELDTPLAERALRRITSTGAVVRSQAPLIRRVNDDADAWAELWRKQLRLGAVPYYMFVERDTGPKGYFAVPLARALRIYNDATRQVSGLGRTVRGPSMSTSAGKVLVDGVTDAFGEDLFVLKFIQARDPAWVGRVFFAAYDLEATWLDELRPPSGQSGFFFERALHDAA
ncbi:MAG: lysine 2,3-aminomutase [Myxococcota bacterium]|nr:lysine 2,3-aminomutase [Myxococcota bacterium]